MMNTNQAADMAERAFWTGAQATLALLAVELADVTVWWAAPVALVLSSAKTWVMQRLEGGNG
jgi:hypothetical protein